MWTTMVVSQFHDDGFVPLDDEKYKFTTDEIKYMHDTVLKRHKQYLTVAKELHIDLSDDVNAEVIPGFYVRQGGRIDMQLSHNHVKIKNSITETIDQYVEPINMDRVEKLQARWADVLEGIGTPLRNAFRLVYVGCVLSHPGDGDQNWHVDGIHQTRTSQQPADRLNVFVPLIDLTTIPSPGGTEMKRCSHLHLDGKRGTSFDLYEKLESVTYAVEAGTPIVMDYRVWHRGRANKSNTIRPLLYFKYARTIPPTNKPKRKDDSECHREVKKRIVPTLL